MKYRKDFMILVGADKPLPIVSWPNSDHVHLPDGTVVEFSHDSRIVKHFKPVDVFHYGKRAVTVITPETFVSFSSGQDIYVWHLKNGMDIMLRPSGYLYLNVDTDEPTYKTQSFYDLHHYLFLYKEGYVFNDLHPSLRGAMQVVVEAWHILDGNEVSKQLNAICIAIQRASEQINEE